MQEVWETYMKPVDGHAASVAFNAEIAAAAPGEELGIMGFVKVPMRSPTAEGFVDEVEADEIGAVEDRLEMETLRYRIGKYVGRIVSKGEVHFIFYLKYDFEWPDVVAEAMHNFPQYTYMSGARMDSGWEVYRRLLFPTEREWQIIHNHHACDRLRENGDDLRRARAIEHRAFFETVEGRRDFCDAIAAEGFTVQHELQPEAEQSWYGLQFYRIDTPFYYDIDTLTLSLISLGARFGGAYDGWETSVVKA